MRRWFGAGMVVLVGLTVLLAPPAASARLTGAHHPGGHRRVCPRTQLKKVADCEALVVTAAGGVAPMATSAPTGYGPADLATAYGFPSPEGTTWIWNGRTIAIVDAFDNPKAAS